MGRKTRTLKEREEAMLAAQELFMQVQKDTRRIKKAAGDIIESRERINILMDYYYGEWLEDSEILSSQSEINFKITNQDSLYNELVDQYEYVKKLLKQCALYITPNDEL